MRRIRHRVAVLALQGAFIEHELMLQKLGVESFEVRNLSDWMGDKDALILPGGESTAMARIMKDEGLIEPIKMSIAQGLPVMGTCAGCILLASKAIEADGSINNMERIGTMDITVQRNAYGRQLGSFITAQNLLGIGCNIPLTFIRAPYIKGKGENVEILASVDDRIVVAREGNQLALTFHPELTDDTRIHQYFLSMI
ncbi:MAG: pyridoxal 5'-phosphate synthase glutaminase subunit PdxT [Marinilabiliaceae bacterium]|nr:pyridoxal 5'-phosphate synthase glutaminase subunit PdxT [Marinilabiliaceae bacterium]